MRFLSTRRKHPAAKPLTLLLALFMMGAVYALVSPAQPSAADPNTNPQVAQGKGLYDVTCSSCHGLNGEGSSQAPSLIGVGAAAVDFQMGTRRMPMAKPMAQAPRDSAPEYSEEEIAAIGAYVATLGAGPGVPSEDKYSPAGLTDEEDLNEPLRQSIKKRLPWLITLMFLGLAGSMIAGIMATYRYAMSVYVMADAPETPVLRCIRRSKEIMHRRKGELFFLELSFIGWSLLLSYVQSILNGFGPVIGLTLGMFASLFLTVYTNCAKPAFYQEYGVGPLPAPEASATREPEADELN